MASQAMENIMATTSPDTSYASNAAAYTHARTNPYMFYATLLLLVVLMVGVGQFMLATATPDAQAESFSGFTLHNTSHAY